MHPAGAAHAFEYNSLYIMDAGHIAVEIDTQGVEPLYTPLSAVSEVTQRLRDDVVTEVDDRSVRRMRKALVATP